MRVYGPSTNGAVRAIPSILRLKPLGAVSKLDTPYAFSNTLCNADRLSLPSVEQEHPERLGKLPHKIRSPDEFGYLGRQSHLDPLLEVGLALGDIRFEKAEGEAVAIASSAPGLSNEEMKEGFLPKQTRGRIKKGHDQAPFSLCPTLRRYPALMQRARRTWRELPRHDGLSSVRLRGEV